MVSGEKVSLRTRLRYDTDVGILSDGEFKIMMIDMLMEKGRNIQKQMGNVWRETETL